jgi:hypothetical protein
MPLPAASVAEVTTACPASEDRADTPRINGNSDPNPTAVSSASQVDRTLQSLVHSEATAAASRLPRTPARVSSTLAVMPCPLRPH